MKNIGKHDFFTRVSLNLIGIDKDNIEFSATKYINYDVNSNKKYKLSNKDKEYIKYNYNNMTST